jgi:hypothetical protein
MFLMAGAIVDSKSAALEVRAGKIAVFLVLASAGQWGCKVLRKAFIKD